MEKKDLLNRTKNFCIRIVNLSGYLSDNGISKILYAQLLRSGTSVGANYRAACRSKSRRDFINKIKTVEEEADETLFWIELIEESSLIKPERLSDLKREANELVSIFVTSLKTARKGLVK
jgi:four helix bundle protein